MEARKSNFDITRIDPIAHNLPGIGQVDYVLEKQEGKLTINLNGLEVASLVGEYAHLVISQLRGVARREITEELIDEISHEGLGFSLADLCEHTRKREVVEARQIMMWWLSKNTTFTTPKIGSIFTFDHATVIHSRKFVADMISANPEFREKVVDFRRNIQLIISEKLL